MNPAATRNLTIAFFVLLAFGATSPMLVGQAKFPQWLEVDKKALKGTAGAGDAFATGMLLGLHEGWELSRCLVTGVCAAAACLSHATCTGGVGSLNQVLALAKKYGFRPKLEPSE